MEPELFTLFEEELGGCRPDRLGAVSEPQGSLPWGARTLSAPVLCVPRLDEGGVAVDSSALAFLEEKEEEKKRMDQLDDLILTGAHVSAADRAAWRRWAVNPPSFERRKEEKEEEEEEEAAEDFLRSFFLSHGLPAQFLVVDVPVWWSLRRFAWLDSGYMYCDSLEGAFVRISHIFYVQMETRVLESALVLLFVVLVAQHLVRQWILVLRQFLWICGRISIITSW